MLKLKLQSSSVKLQVLEPMTKRELILEAAIKHADLVTENFEELFDTGRLEVVKKMIQQGFLYGVLYEQKENVNATAKATGKVVHVQQSDHGVSETGMEDSE